MSSLHFLAVASGLLFVSLLLASYLRTEINQYRRMRRKYEERKKP